MKVFSEKKKTQSNLKSWNTCLEGTWGTWNRIQPTKTVQCSCSPINIRRASVVSKTLTITAFLWTPSTSSTPFFNESSCAFWTAMDGQSAGANPWACLSLVLHSVFLSGHPTSLSIKRVTLTQCLTLLLGKIMKQIFLSSCGTRL